LEKKQESRQKKELMSEKTKDNTGKAKKIIVFKFKPKKGYKRTQGHRQPYTCVEITNVKAVEKKTAPKAEDK